MCCASSLPDHTVYPARRQTPSIQTSGPNPCGGESSRPPVLFTLLLQTPEGTAAAGKGSLFLVASEGPAGAQPVFTLPVFPREIRPRPRHPRGPWARCRWVDSEGFQLARAGGGGLPRRLGRQAGPQPTWARLTTGRGVGSRLRAPCRRRARLKRAGNAGWGLSLCAATDSASACSSQCPARRDGLLLSVVSCVSGLPAGAGSVGRTVRCGLVFTACS